MPKQVAVEEFQTILHAVARHPEGVSAAQLHEELRGAFARRTLVRRLTQLVKDDRLRRRGRARSVVYLLPTEDAIAPALDIDSRLSSEASAVRVYVQSPLRRRRPVSYRRDFLDDYSSNETTYLPDNTRRHLHEVGRPPLEMDRPASTYARQILDRLLIDLSWASSRLEGNTYTRLDTEQLIQFGKTAAGKDAKETQMILNHKRAIEFLVNSAEEISFNKYTFLNLHAILADNLLGDPDSIGKLRVIPVEISGSVFLPTAIPQIVEECFVQMLGKAGDIKDPFEQAFFVMVHVPYLQPFEDVNKRVSRLGANLPLIRGNLCPVSFVDVPERDYVDGTLGVYELNRVELLRDVFVWAYERSCSRYMTVRQTLGEPDPLRLRYREPLGELVAKVVRERLGSPEAVAHEYAEANLPARDRDAFVEMVMKELDGLHEGNIARYRLLPSMFHAWKRTPAARGD